MESSIDQWSLGNTFGIFEKFTWRRTFVFVTAVWSGKYGCTSF
jgi:hypothetical protein